MVWRLALTWTPRLALTWQVSINELPDEQVLRLFQFFDHQSLFHVGNTSKRFQRICQDDSLPNIWASLVLIDICRPLCQRKIHTLFNTRFAQNQYRRFLFLNLRNISIQDLMVILQRGLARGPQQRRIEVFYQRDNTQSKAKKTLLVNVSMTNPNNLNVQHFALVCWC